MPLDKQETFERYFLELRCKLLDVAAILDRVERAPGDGQEIENDPRMVQVRRALELLATRRTGYAEEIQLIFSRPYDPEWRTKFGLSTAEA